MSVQVVEENPGDVERLITDIKRTQRKQTIAMVVLVVALLGGFVWNRIDTNTTTVALCALRADQERQIESSVEFLVDHPQGLGEPGSSGHISVEEIQTGIDNRTRTVEALSDLSC